MAGLSPETAKFFDGVSRTSGLPAREVAWVVCLSTAVTSKDIDMDESERIATAIYTDMMKPENLDRAKYVWRVALTYEMTRVLDGSPLSDSELRHICDVVQKKTGLSSEYTEGVLGQNANENKHVQQSPTNNYDYLFEYSHVVSGLMTIDEPAIPSTNAGLTPFERELFRVIACLALEPAPI